MRRMPATRVKGATPLLLAVFLAVMATSAWAQKSDSDRGRWLPSIAANAGVRVIQVDEASVSSIRGEFVGDDDRLFGYLGGNFQIETPVLTERGGGPRLFARIGAATNFDTEDRVVNEGAPGEIIIRVIDNNGDGIPDARPLVAGIEGRGSATGVKTESPTVTAGFGVDFELAALDRTIHIKPSIEWIWEEERIKTVLGYAESRAGDPSDCPCRTLRARGINTESFYGLGPGIEIEVEAGRLGPLRLGVYAQSQAYYLFDRKKDIEATGDFSDGSGSLTVQSKYTRERWDYRAGFGLRFHWLPE